MPLPDAVEAAEALRAYAGGHCDPLLSKLAGMPPAASELQQEYWQEEMERVRKYADKARRIHDGAGLKQPVDPA